MGVPTNYVSLGSFAVSSYFFSENFRKSSYMERFWDKFLSQTFQVFENFFFVIFFQTIQKPVPQRNLIVEDKRE